MEEKSILEILLYQRGLREWPDMLPSELRNRNMTKLKKFLSDSKGVLLFLSFSEEKETAPL